MTANVCLKFISVWPQPFRIGIAVFFSIWTQYLFGASFLLFSVGLQHFFVCWYFLPFRWPVITARHAMFDMPQCFWFASLHYFMVDQHSLCNDNVLLPTTLFEYVHMCAFCWFVCTNVIVGMFVPVCTSFYRLIQFIFNLLQSLVGCFNLCKSKSTAFHAFKLWKHQIYCLLLSSLLQVCRKYNIRLRL